MEKYQDKGLVSIIMLSHGDSTHIVETVKSILAQTYQNWELLFVAKTDDDEKIGRLQLRNLKGNNDYALFLIVSEEADCYLLKENLAKLRTKWSIFGKVLLTKGIKWRYEVYRIEYRMNPVMSCLYTIRNMWDGLMLSLWSTSIHLGMR